MSGELTHKDSMGHIETIHPNEAQVMSAGTGVLHSEWNGSTVQTVHLLQIWIEPKEFHRPPTYAQKVFAKESRQGRWQTLASPDGRDGSLTIGQDATISLRDLQDGEDVHITLDPQRNYWVQNISAQATINGLEILPGDGLAISSETSLQLKASSPGDIMLFDLA